MSGCQRLRLVRQVMDNESWIKRVLSGANVQTPWEGNPQTWFLTALISARDHMSRIWRIFGPSINQSIFSSDELNWTEHLMKASTMLPWFCTFSCTNRPQGAGESSNGCAPSARHQVSQCVYRFVSSLNFLPLVDTNLTNSKLIMLRFTWQFSDKLHINSISVRPLVACNISRFRAFGHWERNTSDLLEKRFRNHIRCWWGKPFSCYSHWSPFLSWVHEVQDF